MSDDFRELMRTNDEGSVAYLLKIAPKPVDFYPRQSVAFACSGPKCLKRDGLFTQLHAEASTGLDEPIYSELWCARCGAMYLITWGYKDVPMLVERRGWREVERDGTYGKLHGTELLPDGYQLIKDKALPQWYVLYNGYFINEYVDHPYVFGSEETARMFALQHSREGTTS